MKHRAGLFSQRAGAGLYAQPLNVVEVDYHIDLAIQDAAAGTPDAASEARGLRARVKLNCAEGGGPRGHRGADAGELAFAHGSAPSLGV